VRNGCVRTWSAASASSISCWPRSPPGATSSWKAARHEQSTLLRAITASGAFRWCCRGQRRPDPGQAARHHNRPGCCARTTARTTSSTGAATRPCAAADSSTSRSSTERPRTPSTRCLTAMAERQVAVPARRHGDRRADVSRDRHDEPLRQRRHDAALDVGARRFGRLAIGYQDAESERGIVALRAPCRTLTPTSTGDWSTTPWRSPGPPASTRTSGQGSSVRGSSTSP